MKINSEVSGIASESPNFGCIVFKPDPVCCLEGSDESLAKC